MAGLRFGRNSLGQFLVNRLATGLGVDAQARVEGVARVTLTAVQVAAAFTTPVELVAAPGALFFLIVNRVVVSKAAGTAFAGIAVGEDIQIEYGTANTPVVPDIETTGFLDATTAEIRIARSLAFVSGLGGLDATALLNDNIEFSLLIGDITGGSPVIVDTYYERFPSFLA